MRKIVVLVVCVTLVPRYGILVAWVAPSAFVLAASAWLLHRRLLPSHTLVSSTAAETLLPRAVMRYAGGNYIAFLCNLAPTGRCRRCSSSTSSARRRRCSPRG